MNHYFNLFRSPLGSANYGITELKTHSGKDKKESSFVNFEVENARMKLATCSATYSGMKSHFLHTLIKFGALSTKMILNLILGSS